MRLYFLLQGLRSYTPCPNTRGVFTAHGIATIEKERRGCSQQDVAMAALFLTSCQALQANILFAPDFATDGKKMSAALTN
jgi:hypothetical protein